MVTIRTDLPRSRDQKSDDMYTSVYSKHLRPLEVKSNLFEGEIYKAGGKHQQLVQPTWLLGVRGCDVRRRRLRDDDRRRRRHVIIVGVTQVAAAGRVAG